MAKKTGKRPTKSRRPRRTRKTKTTRKKMFPRKRETAASTHNLVVYGKIYADWCGHCQSMKADWDEVEQKMKPVIAFNVEEKASNDLFAKFEQKYKSKISLQGGYPTIYKLAKIGAVPEYYDGARNTADILNWLKSSSTVSNPPVQTTVLPSPTTNVMNNIAAL